MSVKRTLPASCVLALVMLVSCKEPLGLPSDRVLSSTIQTKWCDVSRTENQSGYISMWAGVMESESAFYMNNTKITRGYKSNSGRPWPNNYGYCTFNVPNFSSTTTPVCSLYYYQCAHNNSVNLLVDLIVPPTSAFFDDTPAVYHAAETSSVTIATDIAQSDGWHVVALTSWACNEILRLSTEEEQPAQLFTGWIYTGSLGSGDSATVSLTDVGYAPRIKVVYDDGQ